MEGESSVYRWQLRGWGRSGSRGSSSSSNNNSGWLAFALARTEQRFGADDLQEGANEAWREERARFVEEHGRAPTFHVRRRKRRRMPLACWLCATAYAALIGRAGAGLGG